jgi:hypothetical protein
LAKQIGFRYAEYTENLIHPASGMAMDERSAVIPL